MTLALLKRLKSPLVLLIISIFISGCASRQDLVYFQTDNNEINTTVKYELTYKPDDLLTIAVSALDMDAVRPFNLYVAEYRGGANGITSTPSLQTYLVDADGNIDFPVIGAVSIADLTRKEATRLITDKLRPYVKDPIVNIRLINFKISVLGEVNRPGSFNIPNERVTLIEALGLAGDLNIQARRLNVLVVREIDGKVTKTYIDLRSNAIFSSPFYYLQQNDMVYVEPNGAKIKSSRINPYTGITLSAISTLISLFAILTR
ncbi:MAG: polysaccharide export protein [Flavobacteriaceae bacterium]|nr:polysaccharide export protein [Flavobacteriaceae bacterium]